ncbi:MAG: RNA-directed DNA polymerase [Oscillospiraceae bacterium]
MLMRQLRKIMMPRLYEYACGSIPGRGPLFAARAMVRWRDSYGGKKFYVAELDIRKFYGNVDTEILKAQLSKFIRDKRFLRLLFRVIDAAAPGLPLGFYTSPWLGNFHLTPVDRYIKQELRPDHYLRYADNFFLFSKNKKELHRMISAISDFLARELHTELKGDWQVFRFEHPVKNTVKPEEKKYLGRAINSLGYVIHCDRVTMRKSTLKRARAKGNRMHRLKRCRRIDAAAMVSYMGWFKHTDTYNYYKKHIKPMVSIKQCKKRISKMAKKGAKKHDRLEKGTGQQRNRAGGTGHGEQQHHGIRAEEYPPGAGARHTGHHRREKRHPVGV